MLLREMERLVEEEAPGPHPSFALVHALYALFVLDGQPVGRQKLASTLSIGEGSVRTLLRKLTRRGLVSIQRSGCSLTPKGEKLLDEASASFYLFEPRRGSLPGRASFGVGVRGGAELAKGIQERDEAIKAGAEGAITLVSRGGELYMPGLVNVSKEHPELSRGVLDVVAPTEGDAMILSWGRDRPGVVYGSLGAAWRLFERMSRVG
ncbi:MAG TPA: DUF4443 domain-containing protein [Conexivisphaerales archaeon]|nr:DUF4443 domain-containing protein [Conexivisphaerales archaeon]